jgi:hypothetical protein
LVIGIAQAPPAIEYKQVLIAQRDLRCRAPLASHLISQTVAAFSFQPKLDPARFSFVRRAAEEVAGQMRAGVGRLGFWRGNFKGCAARAQNKVEPLRLVYAQIRAVCVWLGFARWPDFECARESQTFRAPLLNGCPALAKKFAPPVDEPNKS